MAHAPIAHAPRETQTLQVARFIVRHRFPIALGLIAVTLFFFYPILNTVLYAVGAPLPGPQVRIDTNARSLLQVNVKEIDEANTLFDELMGDKVEPRRDFIEQNALTASVDV